MLPRVYKEGGRVLNRVYTARNIRSETFEMIFTRCGRAMKFVDYVTLELTARTAK